MSRHLVVASWLHIVTATFVLGCVAVIWVAASLLAATFEGTFVPGLVAMFGKPIAVVLIALASIELLSAIAVLSGHGGAARVVLAAISVLLLFVFPIGTTLAAYTFFALMQPIADARIVVANAVAPVPFSDSSTWRS